jgi:diketogulonate reductase-like aldo/keto reductase
MEYPLINFGTYRLLDNTYKALEYAFDNNYTSIDTASLYKNEHIIGNFLTKNEVKRNNIWITSKLNPKIFVKSDADIIESIHKTLSDLNTNYLDLFLIHCPKEDHIIKSWAIMEHYYKEGIFKNIGVSNFDIQHIEEIKKFSNIPIYTNQIEVTPFLKRPNIINYMKQNNILVSAHSSLAKGEKLDDPILKNIAFKYNKTPAQIMLKWALQSDYIIMPRSCNNEHINENINLDFEINNIDMDELNNISTYHITHPQYILN